jgi:hypothetical protein
MTRLASIIAHKHKHKHASVSNLSLLTAGMPSGSMTTARLLSSTIANANYRHCPVNQNRASSLNTSRHSHSQLLLSTDEHCQHAIVSDRTSSDTYLTLSRKDIDDVIDALHTLARCINNDYRRYRAAIDDDFRVYRRISSRIGHMSTMKQMNARRTTSSNNRYAMQQPCSSFDQQILSQSGSIHCLI